MSRIRAKIGRAERPVLLILTEDSGGVSLYFEQTFKSRNADKIAIQVRGLGEEPKKLLLSAKTALAGGNRRIPAADFVLLVFDCDTHEHFLNTLQRITAEPQVLAFVSIPCIEFFFLLHTEMTTAPAVNYEAVLRRLRAHDIFKDYDKKRGAVPVAALSSRLETASLNAGAVREACRASNARNPYTDMDLLHELVEAARRNGIGTLLSVNKDRFFKI